MIHYVTYVMDVSYFFTSIIFNINLYLSFIMCSDSGCSSIEEEDDGEKINTRERFGSSVFSDDDSDSDAGSDISDTPLEESLTEQAKRSKQYFWQYNVQAKGPKGARLKLQINDDDPQGPMC